MKLSHLFVLSTALVVTGAIAQQAAAPTTVAPAETVATGTPTAAVEAAPAPAPVVVVDTGPATAGDPKAGQAKAGACAACHGLDGNASLPIYPKLAGQHEHYIWRQLHLYQNGGRDNAIMLGMAATLTQQDMRDIGAYFSTQKVTAGVADDTVISTGPLAGQKFYTVGQNIYRGGKPSAAVPACMACHGPAGAGIPGPSYPALGGQHAEYTVAKLTAFRDGMVWGKDKEANVIMSQAAKGLSDEEIQSLASFLQGLHKADRSTK